jgi:hypothetical protein
MHIGELPAEQFNEAAEALGDTPYTVLSAHALRHRACRAYIVGELPVYAALIVQRRDMPGEPTAYGRDAGAIWRLLQFVDGWDCIELETEVAPILAALVERERGVATRLYGDIHYVLDQPASMISAPGVRRLTPDDLPLFGANPDAWWSKGPDDTTLVLRDSICAGAIIDRRLVAIAEAGAFSAKYADIGVSTLEGFRGRGLATAAAGLVAAEIQRRGLTPVWSCGEGNLASNRVAQKVGFSEVGRMVYVIPSPARTQPETEG